MTSGARAALSTRTKVSLLLLGPLLVFLLVSFGSRLLAPRQQVALDSVFAGLLQEAAGVTALALERSPGSAMQDVETTRWAGRLEGVGVVAPDGKFESWAGTPVEPGRFAAARSPAWVIHVDGVRTRLAVRAGTDPDGSYAVASFLIDSPLEDFPFGRLLPPELRQRFDVELLDAPSVDGIGLRSPAGDVLAVARVLPADLTHREGRLRELAIGAAAATLVLLLAILFDWSAVSLSGRGLAGLVLLLVALRGLLVLTHVPSLLLPRELGSPSLFGTTALWGLLGSPADLLLTAAAFYLLCLAARRYGSALAGRRPARALALAVVGGGLATAAAAGLTFTLARNSRLSLIDRPAPLEWNAELVPWLGLVLALLGAAELWALAVGRSRASSFRIAAAFLVLVFGASALLQLLASGIALEQLASRYAPEILEQSLRREVALKEALRDIHDQSVAGEGVLAGSGTQPEYLAYRAWAASELFHSGYKSALDFYQPTGERISRFSFDLPPLQELLQPRASAELEVRREDFDPVPALQQTLLHAETSLLRDGEIAGFVIGHVLDEPENLPFLPWSQPYLQALGPGSPQTAGEEFTGGLHYVLYDGSGNVLLSSLRQPPADTDSLRNAARERGEARVLAGGQAYVGLALPESDGRLHLLLVPARGVIERLSAGVRLALIGLALLALLKLLPRLLRPHGLRELVRQLRGSFYRKLLATLLVASILPLLGLALFLRGYIERQGRTALISSATQLVSAAQRVLEDYAATPPDAENGDSGANGSRLNDDILYWLRGVVGQEIHVYSDGVLKASSKRELFASGLLLPRLPGEVQARLVQEGLPYLVLQSRLGRNIIPVAYAPLRLGDRPPAALVVAVPLVIEQRQIERGVSRIVEMILLATVALVGLQALAAAFLARTVAEPVRDLVGATGRIASGDYATRLKPSTQDEVAELVRGFNSMAGALASQRSDLERRRDYMEALLHHATTGVISIDPAGRVVTANPAATLLLDSCQGALRVGADLARSLLDCPELAPLGKVLGSLRHAPGEPIDVDLERQNEARRLRVARVELHDAAGRSFGELILLDDVTDLMRSNQLAAWAEMARAIAHEIKNPLTPIQLSAEHLRRLLRDRGVLPAAEIEDCIETIIKQVRALYDIAGEFSAYAKLPALAPEPTDPVTFMRATIDPYRTAEPPGVKIEERYEPAPSVAMDRRVLGRAVINLVENALDAMAEGGTLTVSVAADDALGEVVLSVRDTGPGLGAEARSRLFEPYFSTKSAGTGLGLAIVHRAVEAHRGRIEVESEARRGTAFHIHLPVYEVA